MLPEQNQDSVGRKEGGVAAGRQPIASATDDKTHKNPVSNMFLIYLNKIKIIDHIIKEE